MFEKIDIIIPTNKPKNRLKKFFRELTESLDLSKFRIISTHLDTSAAVNRNWGLHQATSDVVIMIDDDISGFYPGWAEELIQPLLHQNTIVMISARLMRSKTKLGVMMNIIPDMTRHYQHKTLIYGQQNQTYVDEYERRLIPIKALPSACIAFRKTEIRFDCAYRGAGFEDTDFCMQLNEKFTKAIYMINNNVKLIHKNEMKNQLNGQLLHNQQYYLRKWGL